MAIIPVGAEPQAAGDVVPEAPPSWQFVADTYFVADVEPVTIKLMPEVRLWQVFVEQPNRPFPEVVPKKFTEPLPTPTPPRRGAKVNVGAALPAVALSRSVPLAAVAIAAVSVPVAVTAVLGVELRTVPSPVKVTLVTPPEPVAVNVTVLPEAVQVIPVEQLRTP